MPQTFHDIVGPVIYSEPVVDNLDLFLYGLKDDNLGEQTSRFTKFPLLGYVRALHLTNSMSRTDKRGYHTRKRSRSEVKQMEAAIGGVQAAHARLASLENKNVFLRLEKLSLGRAGMDWSQRWLSVEQEQESSSNVK